MENKDIVIIALAGVAIYLYYHQQQQENNQSSHIIESPNTQKLRSELNYYQTLYKKRVEKDLANEEKIAELNQDWETRYNELEELNNQQVWENKQVVKELKENNTLYQQKVSDLETTLLNLAKQKIKGKKEALELLANLEQNWTQEKVNLTNELTQAKQAITNLNQELTKKTQTINQQLTQISAKDTQLTKQRTVLEQLLVNREKRLQELGENHD